MATFPHQLRDSNLIDFNSPGDRSKNKISSDPILIVKDSPEVLSKSFGMNNPFDQVLYQVHLNYLKETDPFEIVSEAAFGEKKQTTCENSRSSEATDKLLPLEDEKIMLLTPNGEKLLNKSDNNSLNILSVSTLADSLTELQTPKNVESNAEEESDLFNNAFKVDSSEEFLQPQENEDNKSKKSVIAINSEEFITPKNSNVLKSSVLNKSSEKNTNLECDDLKNSSSSSLDLIDDEIIIAADKEWDTIDKHFDSKFLDMDSILLNSNEEIEDFKSVSMDFHLNTSECYKLDHSDFYTIKSKSQNIPLIFDEQISPESKERAQGLVAELNQILNKSLTNFVAQETMRGRSKSFSQLPTSKAVFVKSNDAIKKRMNSSFDGDRLARSFSFSKASNTSLDKIEEADLNEKHPDPLVKPNCDKEKFIDKALEKKAPVLTSFSQRIAQKFRFKPIDVTKVNKICDTKTNIKKGPLKAVIPIGNMAKIPVQAEKNSKLDLKITTTPKLGNGKLVKPLAQSTPERKFLQNVSPLAEVTPVRANAQITPNRNQNKINTKGNVPRRSSFSGVNKKVNKPNLNYSDNADKSSKSLLRPLKMISKFQRSLSASRIGKENINVKH